MVAAVMAVASLSLVAGASAEHGLIELASPGPAGRPPPAAAFRSGRRL